MQEPDLLYKIAEEVELQCKEKKLVKVKEIKVSVNEISQVDETSLLDQLHHTNKRRFGKWTKIIVEREDLPDQVAILKSIDGENESD